MNSNYSTVYEDILGTENTFILNDGMDLQILLRGRWFQGSFGLFYVLSEFVKDSEEVFQLTPARFLNNKGERQQNAFFLRNYQLTCEIPIPVFMNGKTDNGLLSVHDDSREPVQPDQKELQITLKIGNHIIRSSGKYGEFFSELGEVNKSLPDECYIQSCLTCRYSLDNPFGISSFANLGCFRNGKEEIIQAKKVRTKKANMMVWDKRVEDVQEIYLCSEYEHDAW
jgi:hypothetical protein